MHILSSCGALNGAMEVRVYRGDPTFVDADSLVPGDIISLEAQAARLFSRLRGLFCTMFSSRKRISDFEIDEQARPVKVFTILIVDILLLRIFGTSHRYRRERTATTVSFASQYKSCMMTSTKMFSPELRSVLHVTGRR